MGVIGLICTVLATIYFADGILAGQGIQILFGIMFGFPALVLLYLWNKKDKPKDDSVLEALKMRYVNGEITKEEFEEKREELTEDDE